MKPLWDWFCRECSHLWESSRLERCPACGSVQVLKRYAPTHVVLRGKGWGRKGKNE